jgi:hypothetical protein
LTAPREEGGVGPNAAADNTPHDKCKAKEEGAFQETHGIAKLFKAKEERERSKQGSKYSLVSVSPLLVSVSASSCLSLDLASARF